MGFMKAMKSANNSWAMVSCESGIGYLGPENLIDNRAQKLLISIGTNTFTFSKSDVKSVDLICATSEWIKYAIVLKNNMRYIATFMALSLSNNKGKNSSMMKTGAIDAGKKVSMGLLNFEWWMSDFIYKTKAPQSISTTTAPTTIKSSSTTTEPSPVNAKSNAATPAPTSVKAKPAPITPVTTIEVAQEEEKTTPQTTNTTISNDNVGTSITDAEKETQYCFAVQMISMHSYNIAYNALSKIKGYKNADELLQEIKDKV